MIARFIAALPFTISVPDVVRYQLTPYEDSDYVVVIYPPLRVNDQPLPPHLPTVKLDGQATFHANGLRIDFHKESFDRRDDTPDPDPPLPILLRAANGFLRRMRYVTRAHHIHELSELSFPWFLRYLNDDESELEMREGSRRGIGALMFRFSAVGLSPSTWDQVHSLPPDFDPPVWSMLHLDAAAALPHIGTAIVLAAAALEVFIAQVLDRTVARSSVPPDLWAWIEDRGHYTKEPNVSERYDVLLRCIVGHSLKEHAELWEAFKNVRDARNSFAHEGIAKIGGKPVGLDRANHLIVKAREIIDLVLGWMSDDLRWPVFTLKTHLEVTTPAIDVGAPDSKS